MVKAPFLIVALLLVELPWQASSAAPVVARWASAAKLKGMAQFVRARRVPYRQRRRAHHAKERAVEPGELERAHKPNRGETPEQRSSAAHRSPPAEPGAPSPEQRASREKLGPPGPHSKPSPAPSVAPSVPTNAPERGTPVPGASGTNEPPPQPPPNWSDAEVIGALRRCVSELAPTGALVQTLEPIRNGQCGTPAPVRLRGFMLPIDMEVSPPAVVNCRIVSKLHDWIRESLQPAAEQDLKSRITRIVTVSSYDCRNRIGSASTRISEHAYANAIDISAVVTADGRTIDVLTNWGPTARDLQKQSASADDGRAEGESARAPSRKEASGRRRSDERKTLTDVPAISQPRSQEAAFLRDVHAGACRIFGTVLGPEANEAHRNHLHLDLAPRKRSAFCE